MTPKLLIQSLEARMRSALNLAGELPELELAQPDVVAGFETLVANYEALIATVAKSDRRRVSEVFVPFSAFLADSPGDEEFRPTQRGIVEAALARASGISHSQKPGHNLALICSDFLDCNGFTFNVKDREEFLTKYARLLGVLLIAVDPKDYKPVVNGELMMRVIDAAIQLHCASGQCHRGMPLSKIVRMESKRDVADSKAGRRDSATTNTNSHRPLRQRCARRGTQIRSPLAHTGESRRRGQQWECWQGNGKAG